MARKKTIAFDFDGTITKYNQKFSVFKIDDDLVDGIKDLINKLHEDYRIVIISARANNEKAIKLIEHYLDKHNIKYDKVTNIKVQAHVYIDDRAIEFNGDICGLTEKIQSFEPWYKKNRLQDSIVKFKQIK